MKASVRKDVVEKLGKLNGAPAARKLKKVFAEKGFLSKRERKILDKLSSQQS